MQPGQLIQPLRHARGRLPGRRSGQAEAFQIHHAPHALRPRARIQHGNVPAQAVARQIDRRAIRRQQRQQRVQIAQAIGNRVVVHRTALARQAKAAPVGRHHAARARKTVAEGIGHELERRAHIHPPVQQHQQRRVRIARRRAPFAQVHADVPQRHVARAQRAQRGVSGCVHGRPFSGMALPRLDGHAKCDPFTI